MQSSQPSAGVQPWELAQWFAVAGRHAPAPGPIPALVAVPVPCPSPGRAGDKDTCREYCGGVKSRFVVLLRSLFGGTIGGKTTEGAPPGRIGRCCRPSMARRPRVLGLRL